MLQIDLELSTGVAIPLSFDKEMNPMQHRFLFLIAIGFCSCLSIHAEDAVNRTADIKITHQIAKDSIGGDVCATMAGIGIDFPVLLQRALDGEDRAIRLLIWAGEHARLDGAASEGYSYAIVVVAKKIGDARMTAAVKELKMEGYENTKMFFRFEFGAGNDEAAATAEIKKLFPTFWNLITNRGEQGGADQPAAAPQSKPTDDDSTPNPESKLRPQ